MSEGRPPIDPFAEGSEDKERERRRLEREAKRRARSNRESLASRVGGLLDGAAAKGREAIEQTRERAKDPSPPAQGVEPPSFRRSPAAPAASGDGDGSAPAAGTAPIAMPSEEEVFGSPPPAGAPGTGPATPRPGDENRLSAEALMPRRPPRRVRLETEDREAVPPAPVAPRSGGDGAAAAPPAEPPAETAPGTGGRPPRRGPGTPSSGTVWRRRALALLAMIAIVAAGLFAVSRVTGGDSAPAPKAEKPVKTTDITIPEGLTIDDMAAIAKKAGLEGDYAKEAEKAVKRYNPQRYGAPKDATLEGFLFPATYEVEKGAPVRDLVDKQLEAFDQNFSQVDLSYAKKKNLTPYDVVTIASMIEREVQVPSERPKVAAVIYNRLAENMPLEIDATVRYALGNDYEHSLTTSDLQTDSPYNTYRYPGLPKGPISNPGLDSLQAAASPSDDNYLYYVVKPGTCGEHFFTDSYDEFSAASAEYDAAQAEAGGSPTDC
jgi:UPF0755 protein